MVGRLRWPCVVFFFNDTATTEIYTLSLHDALPISRGPVPAGKTHRQDPRAGRGERPRRGQVRVVRVLRRRPLRPDRKSTRLNSSHANISYAVFCLKKKKTISCNMLSTPKHFITVKV